MITCKDCGAELRELFGPNLYCSNKCDIHPGRKKNPCSEIDLDLTLYGETPKNARGLRFYIRDLEDIVEVNSRVVTPGLAVSTEPKWGRSTLGVREIKILGRFNFIRYKGVIKKIIGEPILVKWK